MSASGNSAARYDQVVVLPNAKRKVIVVALELQRVRHADVGRRPIAERIIEIPGPVLKPHADVALRLAAHHRRVLATAFRVHSRSLQRRVAPDPTQHPRKLLRFIERRVERHDAARAQALNRAAVCVGTHLHALGHHRKNLIQQATQVRVADRVVFDGSLVAIRACARLDENVDHRRNPFLSGQVVERLQNAPLPRPRTREVLAIAPHLHGERCHAIPLRRHVEPHVGLHVWIYLAGHLDRSGELALRHAGLGVAVGTERGEIIGASDRFPIGDPRVLVSRPRVQARLYHPHRTCPERGDRRIIIDLERRTFLGRHGKYKIAHLARRRRAFLNIVGAQCIAHTLFQPSGAHASHL